MKTLTLVVSLATVTALAALVVRYGRPRVEYRRKFVPCEPQQAWRWN